MDVSQIQPLEKQPQQPLKILLVRLSSLGDVLHNMPMVADILRHYPDAQIDWAVEENYVDLVRLNPGVRRILPFSLRRWRKHLRSARTYSEIRAFYRLLRSETYDYVFDTQGLLKSGLVMGMARIQSTGQRVGLANATEGSGYEGISRLFHTLSVPVAPRTHAVERGRQVAARALAYALDRAADFNLQTPPLLQSLQSPFSSNCLTWLPQHPYAVFFHGSARAAKQWANANWVQLGHRLAQHDLPILLPWGNATEKQTAQQLAAALPNAHVLPALSMQEAIVLAHQASLVVGVDTGLTHIAAAFKRPTIELYCDSPRWKTEGNWADCIVNLGDLAQPPSVAEVEQAIKHILLRASASFL